MAVLVKGHDNVVDSEVRTPEFNMEDFGFEVYRPSRGASARNDDKDYIVFKKNSGKKHDVLVLSLCQESGKLLNSILGEKVKIGINQKGQLCIQSGSSHLARFREARRRRMTISINGLSERIIGIFGEFRRLYFTVEPYGNFNALILKPTGERDID